MVRPRDRYYFDTCNVSTLSPQLKSEQRQSFHISCNCYYKGLIDLALDLVTIFTFVLTVIQLPYLEVLLPNWVMSKSFTYLVLCMSISVIRSSLMSSYPLQVT